MQLKCCFGIGVSEVEFIHEQNKDIKDLIEYLQSIVMNREIPEENKVIVKKQLNEIITMISMNTTQKVLLAKEEYINLIPNIK